MEPVSPDVVETKPTVTTMDVNKLCFICLKLTSSIDPMECDNDGVSRGKLSKRELCSAKIPTSYILQNITASSSEGHERKELQEYILASLSDGKASICSHCIHKAEKLLELHLELEKIQMQILEVLRNLQGHLKPSMVMGNAREILENTALSRFQGVLKKEFMCRELSDGSKVCLERLKTAGCTRFPYPSKNNGGLGTFRGAQ